MKITLEPHPAHKIVHGERIQMVKDQFQIMIHDPDKPTPVRLGYCGTVPGKPISFIRRYPEDFKAMVVEEVERILAGPASGVFEPPPPQVVDDPEDDEDTEQEDEE